MPKPVMADGVAKPSVRADAHRRAAQLHVEADGLLDELRHPNTEKYPNQSVLVVAFDGDVYLVPYVGEPDHYFLKTVIPSRKATRDYLRSSPDEKT